MANFRFDYTVPCASTPESGTGAKCGLTTTADALTPGVFKEGKRSISELGKVRVYDGGPDGDAETANNTLFAVQGLFVP